MYMIGMLVLEMHGVAYTTSINFKCPFRDIPRGEKRVGIERHSK
jgi:hypothetical protein